MASRAAAFPAMLQLVWERGRLMKEAGTAHPGGMAAVMRITPEKIAEICAAASEATGSVVVPANVNAPEQIVISGARARAGTGDGAGQSGGARVTRLAVSIASHSPLMAEAAAEFAALINALNLRDPPSRWSATSAARRWPAAQSTTNSPGSFSPRCSGSPRCNPGAGGRRPLRRSRPRHRAAGLGKRIAPVCRWWRGRTCSPSARNQNQHTPSEGPNKKINKNLFHKFLFIFGIFCRRWSVATSRRERQ